LYHENSSVNYYGIQFTCLTNITLLLKQQHETDKMKIGYAVAADSGAAAHTTRQAVINADY
jgi:hypothetical protein